MSTPVEIQADIERQREQLAEAVDRLTQKLDVKAQTKAKVEGLGRKCITITADLSKTVDIPKIIDTTVKELGHIDILCNNAGIGSGRP